MTINRGKPGFFKTLTGRLLLLTVGFVILADVLIFVPSIARFQADFLLERLRQAQIAALVQLASDDGVTPDLEKELLANAQVYNVVLRRSEVRELVLSSPVPAPVHEDFDLRKAGPLQLIRDSMRTLFDSDSRVIRVIGYPVQDGGELIEITMQTGPLRQELWAYASRIIVLSALISAAMAVALFALAQRLIVVPIRRVVFNMNAFADAPEDSRNVITPSARAAELYRVEEVLASMQRQLISALRQKERLAQLGGAVARISHDLRNILTTAQLFADRMEDSTDPAVVKATPKLVGSINRAINLCESTLAFGKAEEPPPRMTRFSLAALVTEVIEGEGICNSVIAAAGDRNAANVSCLTDIAPNLMIRADREQLYRVLSNLIRNARQAIESSSKPGTIEVGAGEDDDTWWIRIGDTGPGLPPKAREHLFAAFQGAARKGGSGLGLAISAELIRGHGGRLELLRSDDQGTEFLIRLPRQASSPEDGMW